MAQLATRSSPCGDPRLSGYLLEHENTLVCPLQYVGDRGVDDYMRQCHGQCQYKRVMVYMDMPQVTYSPIIYSGQEPLDTSGSSPKVIMGVFFMILASERSCDHDLMVIWSRERKRPTLVNGGVCASVKNESTSRTEASEGRDPRLRTGSSGEGAVRIK